MTEIIFGKNPVTEALRAGFRPVLEIFSSVSQTKIDNDTVAQLAQQKGIRLQSVNAKELDRLSQNGVHQGVVARVGKYPHFLLTDLLQDTASMQLVLALDCVTDPQNLGSLCRAAVCFGVKYIILPKDRSAHVNAVVVKASSGATEHLKIVCVTNLARTLVELKENGYWIYGASLKNNSVLLTDLVPAAKSVLVLGSEGEGMRRLVGESCDVLVKIPMSGNFDSLNVAQAGSVLMYAFSKGISEPPLEKRG